MSETERASAKPWHVGILILCACIALKTAILIADSKVYGRLAVPPVYDDVSYFLDAIKRATVFQSGGLRHVIADFFNSPPHSPYASAVALIGFLVSGNDLAAPYVANAVVMAAIAVIWLGFFKADLTTTLFAALLLSSTAWFDHSVTIFQPDLIAGFGGAVVAALLLFQDRILTNMPRAVSAGLLASVILLIKPTALPAMIVLWSAALLIGLVAVHFSQKISPVHLKRLSISMVVAILFTLPYYAYTIKGILNYIRYNFVEAFAVNKAIYDSAYGKSNNWYYVLQTYEMFGAWSFVMLAGIVLMLMLSWRRAPATFIGALGLIACTVIAGALPTISQIKVPVFGGLLYGMVAVGLLVIADALAYPVPRTTVADTARRGRAAWQSALLLIPVLFIAAFEAKDGQLRFPEAYVRAASVHYQRVFEILSRVAIENSTRRGGPVVLSAFFALSVPVPVTNYSFGALQRGYKFDIDTSDLATDVDGILKRALNREVIVIPDDRVLAGLPDYPVKPFVGELVKRLRSSDQVRELPPVEMQGGQMLIFVRRD